MRAVLLTAAGLSLTEAAIPEPAPDQALLKIRLAGLCNTDLELMRGYKGFTGILGHEFVAEVVHGPTDLVGQRVVGEINVACRQPDCELCRRGVPSQCPRRTTVGINQHAGAFAEYLALAHVNLHAVPASISDVQAVFVEPLAAVLQILDVMPLTGERVVILGAGKLGLLAAQAVRLTGADLKVVVRREPPAALLRHWGIPAVAPDVLAPRCADVVIDCTGNAEGFAAALTLLRPRGTLILKSTYADLPAADLTRIVVDEIRVIGSRCGPFDAALRLLAQGLVQVEPLIEARYPLHDALAAFDHAARPGTLKILLKPDA